MTASRVAYSSYSNASHHNLDTRISYQDTFTPAHIMGICQVPLTSGSPLCTARQKRAFPKSSSCPLGQVAYGVFPGF